MEEQSRRSALVALTTASLTLAAQAAAAEAQNPTEGKSSTKRVKVQKPPTSAQTNSSTLAQPTLPAAPEVAANPIRDRDLKSFQAEADKLAKGLKEKRSLLRSLPDLRIERKFTFRSASAFDFPAVRCDLLAAEAAALIASCISIRKEWETVFEAANSFLTDLDRFAKMDAIFQLQEANGYYELDYAISQGDLTANTQLLPLLANATSVLQQIHDRNVAGWYEQSGWMQLVGWLSHISGYGSSGNATAAVIWNNVQDSVISYCHKAATALADIQITNLVWQLQADIYARKAQLESLRAKQPALQAKAIWDWKNKTFRQQQNNAIRDIYAEKQRLVSEADGPLNFVERLNRLQLVFDQTLSDALSRFNAIRLGFSSVFGIDSPIPLDVAAAINSPGTPQPSSGLLDSAMQWLEELGRLHSRLMHSEQIYSVCFSIRDLLSESKWDEFKSKRAIKLTIPSGLFPGQFNVRLRALSLSTKGLTGTCFASVRIPSSSYFVHSDNTRKPCDQSFVRPVRNFRVLPMDGARSPERFGLNAVHNCSPFGNWQIDLAEHVASGEQFSDLSDLFLELVVAGQ